MNPKFETKNIAIVILSVILAAAIISGSVLYLNNTRIKDNLKVSEKKLLDMNETLIPSKDALIADLQEKLKRSESDISNLEARNTSVDNDLRQSQEKYDLLYSQHEELKSDYEKTLNSKDYFTSQLQEKLKRYESYISNLEGKNAAIETDLSQLQEKLENMEKGYKEEKARNKYFISELSSKDSLLASLQDESTKNMKEIERLQAQLLDSRGEKEKAEGEIGRLKSTYDQLLSDLRAQVKNKEVDIERYKESISVTFVDSILFDSGKAGISAEGREILRKVGDTLREVKSRDIRIIGHTDDVPIMRKYHYKFPTNWELSAARAAAVARYFQKEIGLDPADLEAVGRSSYQPIASNETEQGRARNRRVNIIIGPKIQ